MSNEVQHLTASEEDWWLPAPVDEVTDGYTEAQGRQRAEWMQAALRALLQRTDVLSRHVVHGSRYLVDHAEAPWLVQAIANLQDVRRALAEVEAYMARTLGRDDMAPREGALPDGRTYTVRKGVNRKAWDHDLWRHDVRAQVVSGITDASALVDPGTGETVDVFALLAAVQEVHGSAAPKVGAMKALGLDPKDYCETFGGPWSVQISRPGEAATDE